MASWPWFWAAAAQTMGARRPGGVHPLGGDSYIH